MHFFILFLIEIHVTKQYRPWSDATEHQTLHSVMSDLGLHYLPRVHLLDARHIRAKTCAYLLSIINVIINWSK